MPANVQSHRGAGLPLILTLVSAWLIASLSGSEGQKGGSDFMFKFVVSVLEAY